MGITKLSLDRIERYIKPNSSILILGCQNLYDTEHYGEVAHPYFESLGHTVKSWDITGCQGSEVVDLREDLKLTPHFDLILQHGTVEHCDGNLWQPFKNIHEACNVGGIMIHENPKTGHWPEHGYHYFIPGFYSQLREGCDYELWELSCEPAMGNPETGMNVCCVFKKLPKSNFVTKEQFDTYDLRSK